MNQTSPVIDATQTKAIAQKIQLLDFVSNRVDEMMGITQQRKGSVENRETLGGVERAVTQSTLITEKLFSLHDEVRVRFLAALLETAKVAWKGKSFKRSFIMDDMSMAVLDFDSNVFNEAEYGVMLTNASGDLEMMQSLKSLSQAFLQNGGSMSVVADLYRTKNPASFQRKLEQYEEQMRQAESQQAQAEQEAEQRRLEFEKYKHDSEIEKDIYVAELQVQAQAQNNAETEDPLAIEKMRLEREKFQQAAKEADKKLGIEKDKLKETERHNKVAEAISRTSKKTAK